MKVTAVSDAAARRQRHRSLVACGIRRPAWCLTCQQRTAWIEDAYAINDYGVTWLGIVTYCARCHGDNNQEDT